MERIHLQRDRWENLLVMITRFAGKLATKFTGKWLFRTFDGLVNFVHCAA